MNDIRVMFMGTPIFAREILQHLNDLNYNVVATVSQPDRKIGRKRVLTMTPVHQLSSDLGIDCIQPERIKDNLEDVFAYKPDIIITCAYGQIVPKELLDYPRLGCFNIHASLLPRLRGGAPIHKAIMYGEMETGITIMEMSERMDAGNMILKKSLKLNNEYTTETLEKDLIEIAKKAIEESLPSLIDQSYESEVQDEDQVTYAYNISKEEEYISFDRSYNTVSSHIRSLITRPTGYGIVDELKIKLHSISESSIEQKGANGEIVGLVADGLGVIIDNRIIIINELQPAGSKVLKARDYLNGAGKDMIGKRFK